MTYRIAFLPGDGVGPEVANAARQVMEGAARVHNIALSFEEHAFGGAAIDETGDPLPEMTMRAAREADAVFLGAVGGPKWDSAPVRPEAGLLRLRKDLGVFANLRPVVCMRGLEAFSPLKESRVVGLDLLIVRELTGGLYFGAREEGEAHASDRCDYAREDVERVARIAFEAARKRKSRVVSVDKANVLATSRLWRRTVSRLHGEEYEDIDLAHELVDALAMKLVSAPSQFDVILTENLFGDILSDEASALAGSIGLAPSASLGQGRRGLYEPIHGAAPDIAGLDRANPVGAILSGAMLFRRSLGAEAAAASIETAIANVLARGCRTQDFEGSESCSSFTGKVLDVLEDATVEWQ